MQKWHISMFPRCKTSKSLCSPVAKQPYIISVCSSDEKQVYPLFFMGMHNYENGGIGSIGVKFLHYKVKIVTRYISALHYFTISIIDHDNYLRK